MSKFPTLQRRRVNNLVHLSTSPGCRARVSKTAAMESRTGTPCGRAVRSLWLHRLQPSRSTVESRDLAELSSGQSYSHLLMRTVLAVTGLTLSLGIALAASMRIPHFPKATMRLGEALKRVEKQRQEDFLSDPGIFVGADWATAASFKVRMTNDMDHKWFSAPQEWAWFLTWIPRTIQGQGNPDPRSKGPRNFLSVKSVSISW